MKLMDAIKRRVRETSTQQIRIRKPQQRQVDIHDPHELMMWCRQFGVTPLQLCSVIHRVGNDASAVQLAIRSR